MKRLSDVVAEGYTVAQAMRLLGVRQRRTFNGYVRGTVVKGVAVRLVTFKLPCGKVVITKDALSAFLSACDHAHKGVSTPEAEGPVPEPVHRQPGGNVYPRLERKRRIAV